MNLSGNDRLVRVFGGFVMVGVEYASEFNWDVLLLGLGCWSSANIRSWFLSILQIIRTFDMPNLIHPQRSHSPVLVFLMNHVPL